MREFDRTGVEDSTISLAGTFLSQEEATTAARRTLARDIEGSTVDGPLEQMKPDGLLWTGARGTGQIRCIWSAEVNRVKWQEPLQ